MAYMIRQFHCLEGKMNQRLAQCAKCHPGLSFFLTFIGTAIFALTAVFAIVGLTILPAGWLFGWF